MSIHVYSDLNFHPGMLSCHGVFKKIWKIYIATFHWLLSLKSLMCLFIVVIWRPCGFWNDNRHFLSNKITLFQALYLMLQIGLCTQYVCMWCFLNIFLVEDNSSERNHFKWMVYKILINSPFLSLFFNYNKILTFLKDH